jgi:hypothetical protein
MVIFHSYVELPEGIDIPIMADYSQKMMDYHGLMMVNNV